MYPEDLDLNCREIFKLGIFIIGVSIFYFLSFEGVRVLWVD